MVKKPMQLHGSSISATPQAFRDYESIGSPRLLGSPAVAVPHFLFPNDGIPLGLEYRGLEWERQVEGSAEILRYILAI